MLSLAVGFIGDHKRAPRGGGVSEANSPSSHRLIEPTLQPPAGPNDRVGRELKCTEMRRLLQYIYFFVFGFLLLNYTLCVRQSLPAGWWGRPAGI